MTSAANGRITRIGKGQLLFHAGQECSAFVVVRQGTIKVSLIGESGREIILYRVRPGDICLQTFGCLIDKRPYAAEGVAETALEIELVPANDFQRRVVIDKAFRDQLFAAVASRFFDMERLIEAVALTGLRARLANALLRLRDGTDIVMATHESLAIEINSGRAAVSRTLGHFAKRGLIDRRRGTIHLLDCRRLGELCCDGT